MITSTSTNRSRSSRRRTARVGQQFVWRQIKGVGHAVIVSGVPLATMVATRLAQVGHHREAELEASTAWVLLIY